MKLSRKSATTKGPAETFTGDVWIDPITRGLLSSQLNVAAARFSPGARSGWHSHLEVFQTMRCCRLRHLRLVSSPEGVPE